MNADSSRRQTFGVKSYVHKFYENRRPDFDDTEYERLPPTEEVALTPLPKYPCAYSKVWSKLLYCGVSFLAIGIVTLFVTHLIPLRKVVIGYSNDTPIVDPNAAFINHEVERGTVIGLALALLGGILTSVATLLPAFLKEDDEFSPEDVIKVSINKRGYTQIPAENTSIPSSGRIRNVQPKDANDSRME